MWLLAMNRRAAKKEELHSPTSSLFSYERWLEELDKTPATGWRWRKKGWIETVNICGHLYVTRAAIAEFERRAAAGEFSQTHKTPSRRA